jgi:hypothetical protein
MGIWKTATVLALMVLALAATNASAAQFKAESYPASLTGNQLGTGTGGTPGESGTILSFEGQMTECGSGGFTGELKAASTQVSINQFGASCTAFGFMTASLSWNGCSYRLNVGSGSVDSYSGTIDFVCPAGQKIVITGGECEIQIGAQSNLSTVSYENLTTEKPQKLRVVFNVSGFTYTKVKDGFLCPLNGTGVANDGKLVGGTKVSATASGGIATGLKIE